MDLDLLEALRRWRSAEVEAQSVDRDKRIPAYVIATDATLQALAEQHPSSAEELASIPGIGPRKLDDYGSALLAVIKGHRTGAVADDPEASSAGEAGDPID